MKIWYWVAESHPTADVPYPDPVDIISWDETYYVIVYITLSDAVRRHLCGKLCVDIDVDTCGPAPDLQFPEQDVHLDPCGNGVYYVQFTLPAGTFAPPRDTPAVAAGCTDCASPSVLMILAVARASSGGTTTSQPNGVAILGISSPMRTSPVQR